MLHKYLYLLTVLRTISGNCSHAWILSLTLLCTAFAELELQTFDHRLTKLFVNTSQRHYGNDFVIAEELQFSQNTNFPYFYRRKCDAGVFISGDTCHCWAMHHVMAQCCSPPGVWAIHSSVFFTTHGCLSCFLSVLGDNTVWLGGWAADLHQCVQLEFALFTDVVVWCILPYTVHVDGFFLSFFLNIVNLFACVCTGDSLLSVNSRPCLTAVLCVVSELDVGPIF